MNQNDRRTEIRVHLRVPLRYRAMGESGTQERAAETVNPSQRGLYFCTATPLQVGAQIELYLKLPREISGNKPTEVRCVGRVVHLHEGSLLANAESASALSAMSRR
jgi:hypothetical protein